MHLLFSLIKYTLNSITLLLILTTLVVIYYFHSTNSIEVAEKLHKHFSHKYQLPPHHFTIEQLTPTLASFSAIHLNDPEILHIDNLTVRYYPAQLYYENTAQKLTINGAEFHLKTQNNILQTGNITKFIQHLNKQFSTPTKDKKKKKSTFSSQDVPFETIELHNATLTISQDEQQLTLPFSLTLNKIDSSVKAFLKLEKSDIKLNNLNFPTAGTLSINTQISGTIPILWDNHNIIIENGKLTTEKAGKLTFHSSIPMQDESMKLLMQALKNFNYEKLTITLNTQEDKRLQAAIAFEGKNIDVYGERDINLNVNVFVDILKTIKSILGIQVLSDKLSESISQKKGAK